MKADLSIYNSHKQWIELPDIISKLEEFNENMVKEIEKLEDRIEALEDIKNELEEQVKELQEVNKELKEKDEAKEFEGGN